MGICFKGGEIGRGMGLLGWIEGADMDTSSLQFYPARRESPYEHR